eukprot:6978574-Prymnesium_polylepis.1
MQGGGEVQAGPSGTASATPACGVRGGGPLFAPFSDCARRVRKINCICNTFALEGMQRTPFSANVRAMSNEGLGAIMYQGIGEDCSCETAELSGSWRPPISMSPPLLRFTNLLFPLRWRYEWLQSRWPTASR